MVKTNIIFFIRNEISNIFLFTNFFEKTIFPKITIMLAVHSRRGNPRQDESENVDGNTLLTLDPIV